MHSLTGKAIKDLPVRKEDVDLRKLRQGAGQGKGYKIKSYLWIKIFYTKIPEEWVFFNLTFINKSFELCLDFPRKDTNVAELFSNCSKAKSIVQSPNNKATLALTGKSEADIISFIQAFIKKHISDIICLYNALKLQDIIRFLQNNYNIILTGAPGTGKTHLARDVAAGMIGCNVKGLLNNDQFKFVQFHPSYDYTDFMEGLRPIHNNNNNTIVFERKDGVFKAFCEKAASEEAQANNEKRNPKPYVFLIDEINRGEISKIFGELFFSIDPGYRDLDERIPVDTQYQNLVNNGLFSNGFFVPSNVYVIGTMNDIDRSVESMDFAFRRRFAFYEVTNQDRQESILLNCSFKDEAIKKMDNLNKAIEDDGFSSAYHIGVSYFMKIERYGGDWDSLWHHHLKGVLYEYLRGTPNALDILNNWKKEYDK